jgi:hypothetical protein
VAANPAGKQINQVGEQVYDLSSELQDWHDT